VNSRSWSLLLAAHTSSKTSDRRREERDEMSGGQHSVALRVFCSAAPLLSLLVAPPGVALATCFTTGGRINTAFASCKLGKLCTLTPNAKDTRNKGTSEVHKGTQCIFSEYLMLFPIVLLKDKTFFTMCLQNRPYDVISTPICCVFPAQHGGTPACG